MPSFAFKSYNGYPLIMRSGGVTAGGYVFRPQKSDIVVGITGDYSVSYDSSGNATINTYNMRGLIGDNKANNSVAFYYDTLWARARNRCMTVNMDVALTREAHGKWSEGNGSWRQNLTGWKGGYGYNHRDYLVRYAYDRVESSCAGTPGDGRLYGSAKLLPSQSFYIGKVPSNVRSFWIGFNLNYGPNGWTQWQEFEIPMIFLPAPELYLGTQTKQICMGRIDTDFSAKSVDSRAKGGGLWQLEIASDNSFKKLATKRDKTTNTNSVVFEDIPLIANTHYYVRVRLVVNENTITDWKVIDYTSASIPPADYGVPGIDEGECYRLQHGMLVGNGLKEEGTEVA